MMNYAGTPHEMFASLWRHRELIHVLAKREVLNRYRGSAMGLLWSFINPVSSTLRDRQRGCLRKEQNKNIILSDYFEENIMVRSIVEDIAELSALAVFLCSIYLWAGAFA